MMIERMKSKGYTLVELLIVLAMVISGLLSLAGVGGIIYVAVHFLSKVW
jgi:competence protein ComGC